MFVDGSRRTDTSRISSNHHFHIRAAGRRFHEDEFGRHSAHPFHDEADHDQRTRPAASVKIEPYPTNHSNGLCAFDTGNFVARRVRAINR